MVVSLLLLACAGPAEPPADGTPPGDSAPRDTGEAPPTWTPLPATALLTRASVDLRGVLPTAAELDAVEADAGAVDSLIAGWLEGPLLGAQVEELYADLLYTRADRFPTAAADLGLDDEARFVQSVGDQPLRMVRRVVDEDLPWTDLVTADWTMADETLAAVWPLRWEEGATGWQPSAWTDGRPAAGVFASNSLYWRHPSTDSNANRGRANVLSRVFLCNDYLAHPIPFDENISLVDEEAVREALAQNPGCVSCHVSLDPLAAYFFGFQYHFDEDPWERTRYHPARADDWPDYLPVGPGYFGVPGGDLRSLGASVADDPRFVGCTVETFTTALTGRAPGLADTNTLVAHREAFVRAGAHLRPLLTSILASPAYRAAPSDDPGALSGTPRLLTPMQLASVIEDLTGFRMSQEGWDLMRSDLHGFRLMAGGVDGDAASARAVLPSPTLLLVQERLAELAAAAAVQREREMPAAERRLLPEVHLEATAVDDATRDRQIAHLAWVILGERWEGQGEHAPALARMAALHDALTDMDEAGRWTVVLTAFLRDPALGVI